MPVRVISHSMVFVALGSNLGDSARRLCEASAWLAARSVSPLRRSSWWQTDPVDCPPGSPPFLNAMIALNPAPDETPHGFLSRLKAFEADCGRTTKTVPNEPRPLDMDLIDWHGESVRSPDLILPHPRAAQRRFVLAPLVELAPDLILPGQTDPVRVLLDCLPGGHGLVRRLSASWTRDRTSLDQSVLNR